MKTQKKIQQTLLLTIMCLLLSCNPPPTINKKVIATYPNKQPKTVNYIQKIDGKEVVVEQKEYYENGQLKMGGKLTNGKMNGIWKAYFENGKLQSEGEFINGLRTGLGKVYYPSGKLFYEGSYKNGKETGHWKFYNKKGKLAKEKDF